MNRNRRWTPEQQERLRKLFNAGQSDAEIAKSLGRTEKAIVHRRAVLDLVRIPIPSQGQPYSEEEIERVHLGVERGETDEEIAADLDDRTGEAVKAFRIQHRLLKTQPKPEGFSDEVRAGYENGESDQQMADRLQVNLGAIQHERRKQGLSRAKYWPKRDDTQLAVLHFRGLTRRQIANKMGRSFYSVQRRLYRLQNTPGWQARAER